MNAWVAALFGFAAGAFTMLLLIGLCLAAKRGDEKLADWHHEKGNGAR